VCVGVCLIFSACLYVSVFSCASLDVKCNVYECLCLILLIWVCSIEQVFVSIYVCFYLRIFGAVLCWGLLSSFCMCTRKELLIFPRNPIYR
jgi:hypothetical protein